MGLGTRLSLGTSHSSQICLYLCMTPLHESKQCTVIFLSRGFFLKSVYLLWWVMSICILVFFMSLYIFIFVFFVVFHCIFVHFLWWVMYAESTLPAPLLDDEGRQIQTFQWVIAIPIIPPIYICSLELEV